jgi:hypothetical protein
MSSTTKLKRQLIQEFPFLVSIETSKGNHLRLRLPNGRSVFVSNTPSYPGFMWDVRNDVRRSLHSTSSVRI